MSTPEPYRPPTLPLPPPGMRWRIGYRPNGEPVYDLEADTPAPPPAAPAQRGEYFPPWIVHMAFMLLLGCIVLAAVGVVVVMVLGSIGALFAIIAQNAAVIGVVFIGTIVAAGWAASKIRPLVRGKKSGEK